MKTRTTHLFLTVAALLLAHSGWCQNGLQQIFVEKYYVSNAADASAANTAASDAGYPTGTLPSGSITWRIYADLETGWGVQAVYGVSNHPLELVTSTSFYNHPSGNTTGGPLPTSSSSILASGTTFLDSYLSCGGVAPNRFGVVKSEDNSAATPTGGGANLNFAASGTLVNADTSIGLPLTTADGMYNTVNNPALLALTLLGDVNTASSIGLLTDGSTVGGSFVTTNSSWGVLGEQVGAFPNGTNRVLIGQFTTNGVFTYKLNIQLRNTTNFQVKNFVHSSPVGNEILFPSLSGVLNQTCLTTTSTTSANACGSYTWNGTTYTASGSYTFTTTNTAGCDSIATLNLTIVAPPLYYRDLDGDGYGDINASQASCTQPAGFVFDNSDCNDNQAAVNPGAIEICNGIDDDCDNDVDGDDQNVTGQPVWYTDVDGDGFGDATDSLVACTSPTGYVNNNLDCDDTNATVGQPFTYYLDSDADGYGNTASSTTTCSAAPSGYVSQAGDCNDSNAAINPAASEICNGVDDNCDGSIDNGVPGPQAPGAVSGTGTACAAGVNGTASFSIQAVQGSSTYTWSVPSGFSIVSGQGTTTIGIEYTGTAIQNGISGNLCVTSSDACGTSTPTCIQIDYQVAAPITPGSISGPSKLCPGNNATYSVLAVNRATSYNWTLPTGVSVVGNGNGNIINVSVSGSYTGGTISVNAQNVCGTSSLRSKALALNLPITPGTISGIKNGLCESNSVVFSVAQVSNATGYNWTVGSGSIVSGQGTNSITVNFGQFQTTTVQVNSTNGCGTSATRSLSLTGFPERPGTISGNLLPCTNSTEAYSVATVTGATIYNWVSTTSGFISAGQGTKNASVSWGTAAATNQFVRVTASNTCGTSTTRVTPAISVSSCSRSIATTGDAAVELFPNPANDHVWVSLNGFDQEVNLNVMDASGRLTVSHARMNVENAEQLLLPVSDLAPGIYTIIVQDGERTAHSRLVVQ